MQNQYVQASQGGGGGGGGEKPEGPSALQPTTES